MTKIVLFFIFPIFFNFFENLFCGLINLIIFAKTKHKTMKREIKLWFTSVFIKWAFDICPEGKLIV